MKAYEFKTKVTPDGKLEYPQNLKSSLPIDQEIRVIILVNDPSTIEDLENQDWLRLGAEQFLADECEEDKIYDHI